MTPRQGPPVPRLLGRPAGGLLWMGWALAWMLAGPAAHAASAIQPTHAPPGEWPVPAPGDARLPDMPAHEGPGCPDPAQGPAWSVPPLLVEPASVSRHFPAWPASGAWPILDRSREPGASDWRAEVLGQSSQGRPLIIWTHLAERDPGRAPWVLVVAGQHGDEPSGPLAARCWMRQTQAERPSWWARFNVAVIPWLNPDGAASGLRANAQGVDLNRDHLRLASPETRALARWVAMRPHLLAVLDLHEFPARGPDDHSWSSEDVLLQAGGVLNQDPDLTHFAQYEWLPAVRAGLKDEGLRAGDYRLFQRDAQGERWVETGSASPEHLRNAMALRGVLALLVETRGSDLGGRHLDRRMGAHLTTLNTSLALFAQHLERLQQEQAWAGEVQASLACEGTWYRQALGQSSVQSIRLLGDDGMVQVRAMRVLDFRSPLPRWSESRPCAHVLVDPPEAWREALILLGIEIALRPLPHAGKMAWGMMPWPADWRWPQALSGTGRPGEGPAWGLDMRQRLSPLLGAWLEQARDQLEEGASTLLLRVERAPVASGASALPAR
ncbi:MAG: DUF2817 domain-containing protein [Burkholderiaceae bacterium]|nr:MAG: DUF2817 domain-containing protein [Burkholderiaceae bacterium]